MCGVNVQHVAELVRIPVGWFLGGIVDPGIRRKPGALHGHNNQSGEREVKREISDDSHWLYDQSR